MLVLKVEEKYGKEFFESLSKGFEQG